MGRLTAQKVKTASHEAKQYKLTDGGGLYLLVNKVGKYWRYDYRFLKKRKTLALGVYPQVSLKEARERHQTVRKQLDRGVDPGQHRKMSKAAQFYAAENNFEKLAWEWFSKQNWTAGHARTVKGRLDKNVIPWLGNRPVNEITAQEVLAVCRRVESRGAIETAHRVKTICSQVFRYCVASGLVENDPCRDLSRALTPAKPKNMACIKDPAQVGGLIRAIDSYEGHQITRAALQIAPLVFVRPGELRQAEWAEMDLDQALWKISSEKMKMRQPHLVPLASQTIDIIKDLQPLTGSGRYLFPSIRTTARPMSENTVLAGLRRMGYTKEEMTGHGFRGMASTLLHELGWESHLIERQLAHSDKNSVRAAYNHAEHLKERREMMQAWADYLDRLKVSREIISFKNSNR